MPFIKIVFSFTHADKFVKYFFSKRFQYDFFSKKIVIRLDEEFGPILQDHAMALVNSVIIGVLHSIHDPMRARQSSRSITYHQGTRSAGDYLMAKIS